MWKTLKVFQNRAIEVLRIPNVIKATEIVCTYTIPGTYIFTKKEPMRPNRINN